MGKNHLYISKCQCSNHSSVKTCYKICYKINENQVRCKSHVTLMSMHFKYFKRTLGTGSKNILNSDKDQSI